MGVVGLISKLLYFWLSSKVMADILLARFFSSANSCEWGTVVGEADVAVVLGLLLRLTSAMSSVWAKHKSSGIRTKSFIWKVYA